MTDADARAVQAIPVRRLPAGSRLARVFRTYRDGAASAAWFFSSSHLDRPGRFELAPPQGTCYFADDLAGCWLEVFRSTTIVAAGDVDAHSVAWVERSGPELRLADLAHEAARGRGVTLDLSNGDDYRVTQDLAVAAHRERRNGMVSWIRHDPAARVRTYALFGRAGARASVRGWRTRVTPLAACVEGVTARLGMRILPVPHDLPVA